MPSEDRIQQLVIVWTRQAEVHAIDRLGLR
jgi:hypothetical protein